MSRVLAILGAIAVIALLFWFADPTTPVYITCYGDQTEKEPTYQLIEVMARPSMMEFDLMSPEYERLFGTSISIWRNED